MSISTVEIRAYSGPDLVELQGVNRPAIVRLNVGPKGDDGAAATVSAGTTTTGNAGTNASVTNSGTSSAAVFNFTIPRGDTGAAGPNSVTSATSSDATCQLSLESLEVGPNSVASGSACAAIGECTTSASYAFAAGYYNTASGGASIALGSLSTSSGFLSFVNGGSCVASADFAHAAGVRAKAIHIGASVESDSQDADVESTATNEKTFRFANGYRFLGGTASFTAVVAPSEVKSANFTAENGGEYIAVTTLTVTDPSPSEGASFSVLVRNGTATVGGTAYSTAGTLIRRIYHSGSWANYPYSSALFGTNVATFLQTPNSTNLAAAVTDETGTGSLVFGTSPTIVTPTIAQINGGTAASSSLTLQSTTNATKGKIIFGTSAYDEATNALGIGNASPTYALEVGNASAALDTLASTIGIAVLSSGSRSSLLVESTAASSASAGAFLGAYSNDGIAMASGDRLGGFFFGGFDGSVMKNAVIIHAFTEEGWGGAANGAGVRIGTTATGSSSRTDKFYFAADGSMGVNTTPNAKAILDASSTTKGFLPPRMTTTQRDAITSVPAGLMIYNTSTNKLNFYNGSAWEAVTSA
jgi:hypothetical protein